MFASQLKKELIFPYQSDNWTAVWLTCPADGCHGRLRSLTINLHFSKLIYFVIRNSVTVADVTNTGSRERLDLIYFSWVVDELNKTVEFPSEGLSIPALPIDSITHTATQAPQECCWALRRTKAHRLHSPTAWNRIRESLRSSLIVVFCVQLITL
jgi:hypothetical protein